MKRNKFDLFLENARILYKELSVTPLLYGSLGLEYLTDSELGSDDIDILIPRVFITERFSEVRRALEGRGYLLTDEREHSFEYEKVTYSYADIEDLESFAGIVPGQIKEREIQGTRFLILSLEQYLTVYKRSSEDGYRVSVRQKKDEEKIKFIERELKYHDKRADT